MSWFNRILGAGLGLFFGGPIGSVIGLAIGHMLDKANQNSSPLNGPESLQLAFFTAIFSLLAKVAKADGHISEREGHHFLHILDQMSLSGELRQFAIHTFNEAKNSNYSPIDFAAQLKQIARKMPHSTALLQQFFYTLVSMAAVDGHISSKEDQILRQIAQVFDFSETVIRQVYSQLHSGGGVRMDTAYQTLGISAEASNDEVRSAYRKLVKETHPDKLVQQGLPPEMKASAEKRFHEIQKAWEQIRQERDIS